MGEIANRGVQREQSTLAHHPQFHVERMLHQRTGKKKVYTITVETLPFFSGFESSTLLSGPTVYTLFPCFPRKMVYTIAFFFALWTLGSGDRPREEGCHVDGVHSFFP